MIGFIVSFIQLIQLIEGHLVHGLVILNMRVFILCNAMLILKINHVGQVGVFWYVKKKACHLLSDGLRYFLIV